MADFLEYVRLRRAELKNELAELEAAERVFLRSGMNPGQAFFSFSNEPNQLRPTIKEGILQVLQENRLHALTAQQILEELNNRWWNGELERTSLSPQLSRLRGEKEIDNEFGVWRLIKESASSVAADEAP